MVLDRFSRDAVLGEVTVPLDDNRLLSTLIDRRGVLETFELNIEPTPAPQSPLTKVNVCNSCDQCRNSQLLACPNKGRFRPENDPCYGMQVLLASIE